MARGVPASAACSGACIRVVREPNDWPAMPAAYVVFDVISAGGADLRGYPHRVRRAVFEPLLDGARPPLAIVPTTTDGAAARVWLSDHLEAGIEGVVAKRLDHANSPESGRCPRSANGGPPRPSWVVIEELSSGSFRVYACSSIDPRSGKKHYLRELIPAGAPNAEKEAEKALRRVLQIDERYP